MSVAVAMTGISKRFGAVRALDAVDLEVETGTMHALVGENGAGKTTLMRVLYGAERADAGGIEIADAPYEPRSSRDAIAAGVGMVSQHTSVIPDLTCLQNLMLGAEPGGWIDVRSATLRADALADTLGVSIDWSAEARTLSSAGAQKLEILKLLWRSARIMILDEPTAMLSPADSHALFASLTGLVEGGATVILVTHRLPEVMDSCSRATVLRGGKRVAEFDVSKTTAREIAQEIVGSESVDPPAPRAAVQSEPLLRLSGLVVRGSRGQRALNGADLTVGSGEIVGIAGVDGSGQRELAHVISGILRAESGTMVLDGADLDPLNARQRIALGVRSIPEDRQAEGMIGAWTVEENAMLGLQRLPAVARGAIVDATGRRELAGIVTEKLHAKHAGIGSRMVDLSGGNQQRIVAARALMLSPKLIVAFQPARGMDLMGATQVYGGIREACENGACAVVIGFDLDELERFCDRLVAMRGGVLYAPPNGHERDRETIGRLMVGAN